MEAVAKGSFARQFGNWNDDFLLLLALLFVLVWYSSFNKMYDSQSEWLVGALSFVDVQFEIICLGLLLAFS